MPRKTKKHPLRRLLRSPRATAASIVILCVSLGAVAVPGIFAATCNPNVSNLSATPSNDATYTIGVNWGGCTNDHWKGETLRNGIVIQTWTSNDKKYSRSGLSCSIWGTYKFRVAPAGPANGATGAWQSVTATTRCPEAAWGTLNRDGNTLVMSWRDPSGFSQKYTVYIETNGGGYGAAATVATPSYSYSGACGNRYAVKLIAQANGQYGPYSSVSSVTTPDCPQTPGGNDGGGGGSTGGGGGGTGGGGNTSGGGGGSTTTTSGGGRSGGSSGASGAVAAVLGTPQNFSADVISRKLVLLRWTAAANADHYQLSRSTDNANWEDIASTSETSYTDEDANFSTTYYYRLLAVAANGDISPAVTTEVTTQAFESSSDTITSTDKLVTAKIPEGAIEGKYSCTLSARDNDGLSVPKGQSTLLGPYDLLCVTEDGEVVGSFDKPVQLTMKLASVSGGYSNITVRALDKEKWQTLKAPFDQQKQQISFSMTNAKTFAAFGEKQTSLIGTIFKIFLILLLIGAAVVGFLWWRRRGPIGELFGGFGSSSQSYSAAAAPSLPSAEQEFRQAVAQPDCSHLSMAQQVTPSSNGCLECEQQGTHWNALRICLICGHVGCSDDSPQQHAFKHYQETGHPLIYEYGNPNGNTIGWCYIDQTYI